MFGNSLLLQYDIITEASLYCHFQGYAANISQVIAVKSSVVSQCHRCKMPYNIFCNLTCCIYWNEDLVEDWGGHCKYWFLRTLFCWKIHLLGQFLGPFKANKVLGENITRDWDAINLQTSSKTAPKHQWWSTVFYSRYPLLYMQSTKMLMVQLQ